MTANNITMVNSEAFIRRLEKILEHYGLTAAAFADKVGVQRSSISHLLSGRNKPSLDFVLKVIGTYPEGNLYWLLNGKGHFPAPAEAPHQSSVETVARATGSEAVSGKPIEKIIIFYRDGSFETYHTNLRQK